LRCYGGEFFLLEEHLARFFASAHSLGWELPYGEKEVAQKMREDFFKEFKKSGERAAFVRVSFYHGGKEERDDLVINVITKKEYPPKYYQEGVCLVTVPTRKNSPSAVSPQVKSANMLGGVFAFEEGRREGVFDSLLLNNQGFVTEGSASNFFIVKKGKVLTSPTYTGILQGVTRDYVIGLAQEEGIEVGEIPLTRHDVYSAQEAFLTNTSMGVMPVRVVDSREIGTGSPGKLTQGFMKRFQERIEKWEARIDKDQKRAD